MTQQDLRWVTAETPELVHQLLVQADLIDSATAITSMSPAGDGNMNVTLRVQVQSQHESASFIVKQSRPYVAKYDFIPAPLERVEFEAAFYEFSENHEAVSALLPKLLAWVPEQCTLILEDLGVASDATRYYATSSEVDVGELTDPIEVLVQWLQQLHRLSRDTVDVERFRNLRLRTLNHEHIFEIPFQDPAALDLDGVCPGLSEATASLRSNVNLREKCKELGQTYLGQGPCLLHGDFYPGSWLMLPEGPKVIDPEFCFMGPPEFDFGVMAAHLRLIGISKAMTWLRTLTAGESCLNWELVSEFASVEILRRLLGVAQLPLESDLQERVQFIEEAAASLGI